MTGRRALVLAIALITMAGRAEAQPPPDVPPPPPTPPPGLTPLPPPVSEDNSVWQARYLVARALFTQGRFVEAAAALDAIARGAPDPILRAQAAELASIAREWASARLVLAAPAPPFRPLPPRDERTLDELALLYINTVVWGAGFGATVGVSTEGDVAAFLMPGVGMAAAGVGTIALLDNLGDRPLRYGVPNAISTGLYVGFEEGFYAGFTYFGATEVGPSPHTFKPGIMAAMMWGGSTAGAILGGAVGHELGTTPGRVSFVGSGTLWGGMLSAFVTGALVTGDNQSAEQTEVTAPFIGGLIGTNVGLLTTVLLADSFSPSVARVRFMDLGGLGGGLLLGSIYASAASKKFDTQAFLLLTALGTSGGLVAATVLTSGMQRDEPRRPRVGATWTPYAMPSRGGATAGIAGVF